MRYVISNILTHVGIYVGMIEKPAVEGSSAFLTQWLQTAAKMAEEPFLVETEAEPDTEQLLFESHQHTTHTLPSTPAAPAVARVLQSPDTSDLSLAVVGAAAAEQSGRASPRARRLASTETVGAGHVRRSSNTNVFTGGVVYGTNGTAARAAPASGLGGKLGWIGIAFAVLLLALLWSRVGTLEQQLSSAHRRADELDSRVAFLQGFVALLSANITGGSNKGGASEGLLAELARWQAARGPGLTHQLGALHAHVHALSRSLEELVRDQTEAQQWYARLAAAQAVRADATRVMLTTQPAAAAPVPYDDSTGGLLSALVWLLAMLSLLLVLDHFLLAARVRNRITSLISSLKGRGTAPPPRP